MLGNEIMELADTPIIEAFARAADWQSAMQFCRNLEMVLNQQREALDVADECLALIEEVGHGAMSDNVTAARGVIEKAIQFYDPIHKREWRILNTQIDKL